MVLRMAAVPGRPPPALPRHHPQRYQVHELADERRGADCQAWRYERVTCLISSELHQNQQVDWNSIELKPRGNQE